MDSIMGRSIEGPHGNNAIYIHVPELQDSFSRIVLGRKAYQIRFTWNEAAGRWGFGLYTMQKGPIAVGIRLVPRFPLNLQVVSNDFPGGAFAVFSSLEHIGRNDFKEGKAKFAYIPGGGK